MAPALTDAPTRFAPAPSLKGPTEYKEAFNSGVKTYSAEKELKGTKEQPAAKYPNVRQRFTLHRIPTDTTQYLPVWDAEVKYVNTPNYASTDF